MLVQAGVIEDAELRVAKSEQSRHKDDFARAIIEMRLADEKDVIRVVGEFYNIPVAELEDVRIDKEAMDLLDEEFCRFYECVPFKYHAHNRFLRYAVSAGVDESGVVGRHQIDSAGVGQDRRRIGITLCERFHVRPVAGAEAADYTAESQH